MGTIWCFGDSNTYGYDPRALRMVWRTACLKWRGFMIDYEALREALRDECFAAHFGGGIGPALMDAFDVDDMSPEELVEAARTWGIDIDRFTI